MSALEKGKKFIKILLSQVSKDNYNPFVPVFFPVLGAHIIDVEFQKSGFKTCVCRLKEPTFAQSRAPHVQTPDTTN